MKRIKPDFSDIVDNRIEAYCEKYSSKPSLFSQQIIEFTDDNLLYSDMICGNLVGNLLKILLLLQRPTRVLEVGAFTGYSASFMAEVLAEGSVLYTIEANEKYRKLFIKSFTESHLAQKIKLLSGYAFDIIPTLDDDSFEFIFVDADKIYYPNYLDALKPKLKKGGMIVFDNTLWGGGVVEPTDKKSLAVHKLNEQLFMDTDFINVLLPIRDGVHIAKLVD